MRTIKGFYINPYCDEPRSRWFYYGDFEDDLHSFYKLLHCDTIDIISREIQGIPVAIVCDDYGLFVDNPVPSLFEYYTHADSLPIEVLCGRILICGPANDAGDLTDLPISAYRHIETFVHRRDNNGNVINVCARVFNRPTPWV